MLGSATAARALLNNGPLSSSTARLACVRRCASTALASTALNNLAAQKPRSIAPVTFNSELFRVGGKFLAQQKWYLSTTAASAVNVQLYQYAICPFCNRVKALLDYTSIPYSTTEVNPLTKAEIKPWKKEHNKVPIATIDDAPVFESDAIIENLLNQPSVQKALEDRLSDTMTVESFRNGPTVKKWKDFAANDLAVLLYPNMCRTWGESYRAFDYVNHTPSFGVLQRFLIQNLGSFAMYMAASKIKKRRNISDERQALEEILVVLEKELESKSFLSGQKLPDLGDLYVYGTLRAIRGLPVYESLVNQRGGHIVEWCERMEQQLAK